MALKAKPPLSPQLSNAHTDAMNNLMFLKQQQWTATNYVVAVYAAVFALSRLEALPTWMPACLSALVLTAGGYGLLLLYRMQRGMLKFRERLAWINGRAFSSHERAGLNLRKTPKPFLHDGEFVSGLAAVILIGAVVTLAILWLPEPEPAPAAASTPATGRCVAFCF